MVRLLLAAGTVVLAASSANAQKMSVKPPSKWDGESACRIEGLNPRGDNFLAVRTGPGSKYRMVGKLRPGDTVGLDRNPAGGGWEYSDEMSRNGKRLRLRGFFFGKYCRVYAG